MKNKRAEKAKARRRAEKEAKRLEKAETNRYLKTLSPDEIIARTVEFDFIIWQFALHEEFGFGKKRWERARNRYNDIADSLDQGHLTFDDIIGVLEEEVK